MMNLIQNLTSCTNPQSKAKEDNTETVVQVMYTNSQKQTPKNTPPVSKISSKVAPTESKKALGIQSGVHKEGRKKGVQDNKQSMEVKDYLQVKDAGSKLEKVRSTTKLARQSVVSQQKRMRLSEYLYTVRKSLQKNRQRRNQLRKKSPPGSQLQLKASINELRRNKYYISNEQMHKIVKEGVQSQLKEIIKQLQSQLTYISQQDMNNVTKQDLVYFYDVKTIVNEKIQSAVNQMRTANLKRQQTLIQGIFNIGKDLVVQKDAYIDQKILVKKAISKEPEPDLTQSLYVKKKQ